MIDMRSALSAAPCPMRDCACNWSAREGLLDWEPAITDCLSAHFALRLLSESCFVLCRAPVQVCPRRSPGWGACYGGQAVNLHTLSRLLLPLAVEADTPPPHSLCMVNCCAGLPLRIPWIGSLQWQTASQPALHSWQQRMPQTSARRHLGL